MRVTTVGSGDAFEHVTCRLIVHRVKRLQPLAGDGTEQSVGLAVRAAYSLLLAASSHRAAAATTFGSVGGVNAWAWSRAKSAKLRGGRPVMSWKSVVTKSPQPEA